MGELSEICLEYVKCKGAIATGIATPDTLAGGRLSTDLSYVMPEARSAIVFALTLDQGTIPDFLANGG